MNTSLDHAALQYLSVTIWMEVRILAGLLVIMLCVMQRFQPNGRFCHKRTLRRYIGQIGLVGQMIFAMFGIYDAYEGPERAAVLFTGLLMTVVLIQISVLERD